ncbi:DUF6985 domain-containing protein [Corallococcus terminator]|uniref:DUF6985 domain-containing protein n=1 Tax=Corallococcus terminator TaxID=2316733 RepID=A0A3A8IAL9_9BACT|nr:hypothetical protein D7V88_27575 [Corallococcus terminator]
MRLETLTVHAVPASEPYLVAEFSCAWDEEHGVGVVCAGYQPLEVNTADVAGDVAAVRRHHAKARNRPANDVPDRLRADGKRA